MGCTHHQRPPSEVIRDTQRPSSEAIRGHQRPSSEVIRGHHRRSSEVIRGHHRRQSEAIRGHHRRSSEAIRGHHRRQSEAIRGHHRRRGAHLHDLAAVVDVAREPPEARAEQASARYDAHRQTEPGRVEIAPRLVLGTALVHELLKVGAPGEYPSSEEERRDRRRTCWRDVGGPDEGGNQWSSEGISQVISGHQRPSMVIRGAREVGALGGSDEGW